MKLKVLTEDLEPKIITAYKITKYFAINPSLENRTHWTVTHIPSSISFGDYKSFRAARYLIKNMTAAGLTFENPEKDYRRKVFKKIKKYIDLNGI
jgi:hypothetical protein